jgi:hypothetical protein
MIRKVRYNSLPEHIRLSRLWGWSALTVGSVFVALVLFDLLFFAYPIVIMSRSGRAAAAGWILHVSAPGGYGNYILASALLVAATLTAWFLQAWLSSRAVIAGTVRKLSAEVANVLDPSSNALVGKLNKELIGILAPLEYRPWRRRDRCTQIKGKPEVIRSAAGATVRAFAARNIPEKKTYCECASSLSTKVPQKYRKLQLAH